MTKASISCLASGLKAILRVEAKHIQDTKEQTAFLAILKGLPECENGGLFQLEVENTGESISAENSAAHEKKDEAV